MNSSILDDELAPVYGSTALAVLRCIAFILLIVLLFPVHVACRVAWPSNPYRMPQQFHKILLKLMGFQVRTHGAISTRRPTFFVCNHVSYLDIPVLGSLIQGSFVAKAEVATWPLFGFMAKMQNTVFIERRQGRAAEQRNELTRHLAAGHNLIVFPEGTSSLGRHVMPFKSSLFGSIVEAADKIEIAVQPVSIGCTSIDGLPLTQNLRSFYAWYGDMTMLPHLWQIFKCSRVTVDVMFHPPLNPREVTSRKVMALQCQAAVAEGISQCVSGRWADTPLVDYKH